MAVSSIPPSGDEQLNSVFWEQRYQAGTSQWDLGKPAPPFVQLLTQPDCPAPGRAVVLGCGRGYDALLFARYGFQVLGVDFAPSAIAAPPKPLVPKEAGLSLFSGTYLNCCQTMNNNLTMLSNILVFVPWHQVGAIAMSI